jgi:hypothetical protein
MRARIPALLGAFLVSVACGNNNLQSALPPNVNVDVFNQQAANAVDVLWIVQDSGYMVRYQANLAAGFASFMKIFTRGSIDYRMAVTTTDVFDQAGQFVGNPSIISPQLADPIGTFETNVQVGINGIPNIQGLAQAHLAIDLLNQANAPLLPQVQQCQDACNGDVPCMTACPGQSGINFLRPGAYLYLVFIEDRDDESPDDVLYFYRYFEEAKGIGNDGMVTVATITGTEPVTPCLATLGERTIDLSLLTNGQYGSICDADYSDTLHALSTGAVQLRRRFALSNPPNVQTLSVTIKYPCDVSTDETTYCAATDDTACQGQAADYVGLVCTPVQGGTDGWAYEAGGNLIYFAGNSVPDLQAEIDVEYYIQGTSP